jgi:hypothetical protein
VAELHERVPVGRGMTWREFWLMATIAEMV